MPDFSDSYVFRPFPWLDSSSINSENFCPHSLYVDKFIRGYEEYESDERKMKFGKDGHIIFCNWYDVINTEFLAKLPLELEEKVHKTRIFYYFHQKIIELLDQIDTNLKNVRQWRQIAFNFAYIRALDYRRIVIDIGYSNKKVVDAFFIPRKKEYYMEDPVLQYYGKLDALFASTRPEKMIMYKITDWKTGMPPKSIKEGENKLRTRFMRQINGYVYLAQIEFGVKYNMFEVSVEFLGGDGMPGAFCKKSSKNSINALVKRIHKLRYKIYEWLHGVKSKEETFPKEPNKWKCNKCSIRMSCLTAAEEKEIFEDGENSFQGIDAGSEDGELEGVHREISPRYIDPEEA